MNMPVRSECASSDDAKISPRITNLFHHDAPNIGDRMCGAGQYFWQSACQAENLNGEVKLSARSIVGGGQIFGQAASLLAKQTTDTAAIESAVWGIGLPLKGRRAEVVREVSKSYGFFSTRNFEYNGILDVVPCPSCMMPFFDDAPECQHDVVIFAHRRKTPNLLVPPNVPLMTNEETDPQKVIDFIASGNIVVTSSYHGVYWAQLLGRRVICVPYNEKFQTYEKLPTFCDPQDWPKSLSSAAFTPSKLEEYREINRLFARRVSERFEVAVEA